MKLISAGLISPGDKLVHHQKRKGETHEATVEADGWLTTKLGSLLTPIPRSGRSCWHLHQRHGVLDS